MSDWYSEAANDKMAEVERKRQAGEMVTFADIIGIAEPRVLPADDERCEHCGSDARPEGFGGGDGHFCGLCLNRDRDDAHDDASCERGPR